MSGITDPSELYFKNGTWVWDGSQWIEAVCDSDGAMSVSIHNQDVNVEIEQTDPSSLAASLHGWDGSQWRKLNLLWGYCDRYAEREALDNVSSGDHTINFTTVPSGEIWVVTHFSMIATTNNPSRFDFMVNTPSAVVILLSTDNPGAAYASGLQVNLILKSGDYLQARFIGCSTGDDLRAYAVGYKMKINQ